jgi:hypothetical protein
LRTIAGDAPLARGFEQLARREVESPDGPAARKRTALRALKDLELEHSIGKIDDKDYEELAARYREEAKSVLREIEREAIPLRERAEQIARAHLLRRLATPVTPQVAVNPARRAVDSGERVERMKCPSCRSTRDPDAIFCKVCGSRIAARSCPSCATVSEGDASFCMKCGERLGSHPPEETDAPT